MQIERVEINEVLDAAVEISAYGLQSSGAQIKLEYDPANPCVEVDADQIIQVISNLLINAEHVLRDLGDAGRLTLVTRGCDDHVTILVRDNGPGVPDDLRRRIFEPYFTTKAMGEGTGVGLALCHRMVTAHGGKISVTASEGGGAEFCIRLPRSQNHRTGEADQSPQALARSAHVLVLDDEPDVAATIADMLQRGGYRTSVAHSAIEAWDLCADTTFDAILSDVLMPGNSGLTFYNELRARDPEQADRLAFITGDAMGPSLNGGIKATRRPFIEKPAEPKDILTLVAQLTGGKSHASKGHNRM